MAHTETWNAAFESSPADGDFIPDGPDKIRDLKLAVRERLAIDHYMDIAGTDADHGEHKKVTFHEPISTPGNVADKAFLYTKDVNSKVELHWEDEDGNEAQLTTEGALNRPTVMSLGTDHTATGEIAIMTMSYTGAFGEALYLDTNGELTKADADAATTMPCVAIALEAGSGSKKVLLRGTIRDDSWAWTVGATAGLIFVDVTAGALTQTAPSGTGDQVQVVGYALSATSMYFNPALVVVEID